MKTEKQKLSESALLYGSYHQLVTNTPESVN